MKPVVQFVSAGTLGDALIILSKLVNFSESQSKNIDLVHLTSHKAMVPLINKLFSYFPNISIFIDSNFSSATEVIAALNTLRKSRHLVNTRVDGLAHVGVDWYADYHQLKMPSLLNFGNVGRSPVGYPFSKRRIGIQICTGKPGGNFKYFDAKFISKVIEIAKVQDCCVVLLGTNQCLSQLPESFEMSGVVNMCGKLTFEEWISELRHLDLLISPEGFSAFFAMFNGVKTVVAYLDPLSLGRIHPVWLDFCILVDSRGKSFFKKTLRILRHMLFGGYKLDPHVSSEEIIGLLEK
jgi:hypothetical protein